MSADLTNIPALFQISGDLERIEPHDSGHINRTYVSYWRDERTQKRYVHQRINEQVFKDVAVVMSNIEIVLAHLGKAKSRGALGAHDQILRLVPALDGSCYARSEDGGAWRTYQFIEDTYNLDITPDAKHAEEAAALLGRFQAAVLDIDSSRLKDTIPDFFSSPARFAQLREAIPKIANERSKAAARDIEFALQREPLAGLIESARISGDIPSRVVHGDMKLNNILFENGSGRAVCLLDFDTCMAGYSLFDFADLVRSGSVPSAEDEEDLSKVVFNLDYFAAFARGYLAQARTFLTPFELAILPLAPRVLALTLGVRFLTDYLNNDRYFKVKDAKQNLRRARTQLRLAANMEDMEGEMKKIVAGVPAS